MDNHEIAYCKELINSGRGDELTINQLESLYKSGYIINIHSGKIIGISEEV